MTEQSDTAMAEQARENTALDVAAIRARADAATPGPWLGDIDMPKKLTWRMETWIIETPEGGTIAKVNDGADQRFLIAARTDIPALCDALEAAHRRIADLIEQRDYLNGRLQAALRRIEELEGA